MFFGSTACVKTAYVYYPYLTTMDVTTPRSVVLVFLSLSTALVKRTNYFIVPRGTRLILLIRMILGTISMLSFFTALELLPTNKTVVLSNLMPVMTAILAAIFLKEKMHCLEWIGVIVAFGGVVLVSLNAEGGST